ncbi:radical SAM protein [Bacillus songklensis]|uniref:Radical SAM protein n=1 Tax=Bacillus songklensis TaxID=1069116 RepID=A0ABV8AXI9_9BACI
MSNIMINKVCNLDCPYCFANDYVNVHDNNLRVSSNMTIENYQKSLEFALKIGTSRIGILGGEPTLHPEFKEILKITKQKDLPIMLFTNGVYIDKYYDIIEGQNVNLLINCNSEKIMGKKQFKRMYDNITYMVKENIKQPALPPYLSSVNEIGTVTLGLNMYEPGFEYEHIIDLVKETGIKKIRTSIAVPNTEEKTDSATKEYFYSVKPTMIEFFLRLKELGAVPIFDCNKIPLCVLTPEEVTLLDSFNLYEDSCGNCKRITNTNLLDGSNCSPVIDILPDLSILRCFGLSGKFVKKIDDFKEPLEVIDYYYQKFDSMAYTIPTFEDCIDCPAALKRKCMGGCLAFKMSKYDKVHEIITN